MSLLGNTRPIPIKLLQLVFSQHRIHLCTKRTLPQVSKLTNAFTLVASYAFLWPLAKSSQLADEKVVDDTKALIEIADNLFENGHYDECYLKLLACNNKENVEVQWRIVRALYNMSKESKYNKREKQNYVYQAYDIISKLLPGHSDHHAVHKWYALILDSKSSYEGIKERIRQLENVKKHMDLAVTLNPKDATCLHMLGEWCYQITEMPWHHRKIAEVLFASPPYSTYEDALEYFLKAETVEPRFYSMNLLRIGSCYLKLGKGDQAKYYLKLAASYPAKCNDDHLANKEASEMLKKLKVSLDY